MSGSTIVLPQTLSKVAEAGGWHLGDLERIAWIRARKGLTILNSGIGAAGARFRFQRGIVGRPAGIAFV